jgi:hypothetical protein
MDYGIIDWLNSGTQSAYAWVDKNNVKSLMKILIENQYYKFILSNFNPLYLNYKLYKPFHFQMLRS